MLEDAVLIILFSAYSIVLFLLNYFGLIKIYDKIDLDLKFVFVIPHNLALAPITKLNQNLKLTLRFLFFLNFMIFCS